VCRVRNDTQYDVNTKEI